MRKILLLTLFLYSTAITYAQECDFCGIWTGTFRVWLDGNNTVDKQYIKINKYGETYSVKVKQVYTYDDQSTKTFYWHECTNVSVNGNTISWRSLSHKSDDWDGKRINGRLVESARYYKVCYATINNGMMSYSETIEGEYLDSGGNIIGEYHQPAHPTRELFKDEENW